MRNNNDDDNNDITKFSSTLLNKLDREDKEIKMFTETDPMLTLRKDILNFFQSIMVSVAKKECLKEKIESSFLDDLDTGELTLQERMSLYRLISSQASISADSVLGIFKPTPGAPSMLADKLSTESQEDHFDAMYNSMKPADLQKMDKLMKALQAITREENKNDID